MRKQGDNGLKKRVGILLRSLNGSKYLYETVEELSRSGTIEIFFMLNREAALKKRWAAQARMRTQGVPRFAAWIFFMLTANGEGGILSRIFPRVKEHRDVWSLEKFITNEPVRLNPIVSSSGFSVRYSEEDIERIKSLGLDIIIRGNAPGIFRGEILSAAKEGIISFHHGDNRWNRGGPAAFWEVYYRKPSTGFVIQILTEELDGGKVLFRGEVSTCRSYTENIVKLFNESNPYMAKIILEYAEHGTLPQPEERTPFGGMLLRTPSSAQTVKYIFMTLREFAGWVVNRIILRKGLRWGVAFTPGPWRDAVLRKGTEIKNPAGRFFADPFVVTKDEKTICFVEDYHFKEKKGRIAAIEIIDKKNYRILGPVLEEPFHMSFPFVFEYRGDLFMVPETRESNAIRLYKCVEYPLKWEYQKDILSDVKAVDSMLFEYRSRWWLLTNLAAGGNSDHGSQLFAYHSENPYSDNWIPHEKNPLVFNGTIARNGGLLDAESGQPVRVRQKQGFNAYGAGLTLAQITELTPSTFREREIGQITPDFFRKIRGCHQFHSNGRYTVYDYVRRETMK